MRVRLRAHHLLCLTTYIGRGYSPAFTANYDRVVERLASGEAILLANGPDDICAPLAEDGQAHCHNDSVIERDQLALVALQKMPGLIKGTRIVLTPPMMAQCRAGFASGETRAACLGCEWSGFCDSIAGSGFAGTRLLPEQ